MLNINEYPTAEKFFFFFEKISKIPHGSGNTDKIADYLMDFAQARGLYARRDEANNVIIRKPATSGREKSPTIIFQGHTDMVAEKTADSKRDMLTEGLEIYRDGDFLRAKDTTLGGDDGVAIAYALAILDSSDISHPEFEAIFTSDEETGLIGATHLDPFDIRGKMMINIDSDIEGIFTAGCAGGMRIDATLPMNGEKTESTVSRISVCGLKGGHSGIEIDKGRENAIKLLGELLSGIRGARIAGITGGSADNAIPRSAECLFASDMTEEEIAEISKAVIEKYKATEPDVDVRYEKDAGISLLFSAEDSENLISLICEEPSGVIGMSEDITGLVETSLNLGIIRCGDRSATLSFSVRSAKGAKKRELSERVYSIAEKRGAKCESHGEYPAWEYKKDSRLRDVMCEVYKKMYAKDAEVVTIHAGLECGIFSDKIPGLDCVSIGPDNFDIHTTEEHLSISSSVRVWEYLLEVLKAI